MAEIIKDEAIILRKTKFSNSSLILQLYSKNNGKISVLVKGARSSKSKIGSKIDILNYVEFVFYKKAEREIQLATEVNLIEHYPKIKEGLEKIKYASAICELILKLIPEHEASERIFKGSIKMLNYFNNSEDDENLLFAKYLFFFIKETGFELSFEKCSICDKELKNSEQNAFSYSEGIICGECNQDKMLTYQLSVELYNLFECLTKKNNIGYYKKENIENIIFILEKFLIYHNTEFNGLKSLKIL
jgi:DNA repair protein RecO (recombination protein O)